MTRTRTLATILFAAMGLGNSGSAFGSAQRTFTNRAARPADDCYRRITLDLEDEALSAARFNLFGRCNGELPLAPIPLNPDEPVTLADGTVATVAVSTLGPAIVHFDFTATRVSAGTFPQTLPRYVVAFFADGVLPLDAFRIPEVPQFNNRIVFDSADVRTIPAAPGATFEQTVRYTWSVDNDLPMPDLAAIAADGAAQRCRGLATLVSAHQVHRPTHTGGVLTYFGTFRCAARTRG